MKEMKIKRRGKLNQKVIKYYFLKLKKIVLKRSILVQKDVWNLISQLYFWLQEYIQEKYKHLMF